LKGPDDLKLNAVFYYDKNEQMDGLGYSWQGDFQGALALLLMGALLRFLSYIANIFLFRDKKT